MQMTPPYGRKQRGTKEESEKADLKLNIQNTNIKKKKKKLRSWHPVPSLHGK